MKKLLESPFLNVMLFSLSWALSIFVTKLAIVKGEQPFVLLIHTYVAALVIIATYVLIAHRKGLKELKGQIFINLFIAAAIHSGIGGFFNNIGITYTSAVNAGFLVKFALVWTIILASVTLKEKLTFNKIIAAVVMMIGSYLISTNGALIVPKFGDIILILATLCWSIGNIFTKKILKSHPVNGDVVSLLRPLAALPTMLIFYFLQGFYPEKVQTIFDVNLLQTGHFTLVILNGLFAAGLWIFLNRTLKFASASYMTLMSNITSVIVTVLAILFLGEVITLIQLIGGILIVGASFIVQYLKFDKD